jgi:hypothetical protein
MQTKGKTISVRLSLNNTTWLSMKAKGVRGFISEMVNLFVTEGIQGMEAVENKTRRKNVRN